jgi:hypothetical protein
MSEQLLARREEAERPVGLSLGASIAGGGEQVSTVLGGVCLVQPDQETCCFSMWTWGSLLCAGQMICFWQVM